MEVKEVVPISRGTKASAGESNKRFHDLAVAAALPVPHVVAVNQKYFPRQLVGAHDEMGMRQVADGIRQQQRPAGTQVIVAARSIREIERREIIRDGQAVCRRKLDKRIGIIGAVGVGAEGAVAGHEINIGV